MSRCLILLTAFAAAPPGAVLPEQTRGDLTARLAVHVEGAGSKPGAEVVGLRLTVTGGPLLEVEPPRLEDPLNAWQAERNEWCRLDGRRLTWTIAIRLRQVKPGPATLPDVKVRFRDGPGAAWQEAEWVDVLKTMRDGPPPEFVPPSPLIPAWLPWLVGAIAAPLLVAAGWLVSRRRPRPRKPLPPGQWALQELGRLDASRPSDPAAFHTALSDVVRRYLAERFDLPATRQTTAEFLETVRQSGRLSAEHQELLRDFLARCDLAKFAPVGASAEECREAAALARSFVEHTAGTKTAAKSS
jgi:uncharacterized protein DUF4381